MFRAPERPDVPDDDATRVDADSNLELHIFLRGESLVDLLHGCGVGS